MKFIIFLELVSNSALVSDNNLGGKYIIQA